MFLLATARKPSLGQGHIFTPVCHSVHGGDGIPACIAGGILACLAVGVCYPSMPCSRVDLLQGVPGPGGCLVEMTPRTATAAGGTHPTGMHSCSLIFFVLDPALVSLYWSENESASRWVHSESNLIFKPCSDKDQGKNRLRVRSM